MGPAAEDAGDGERRAEDRKENAPVAVAVGAHGGLDFEASGSDAGREIAEEADEAPPAPTPPPVAPLVGLSSLRARLSPNRLSTPS